MLFFRFRFVALFLMGLLLAACGDKSAETDFVSPEKTGGAKGLRSGSPTKALSPVGSALLTSDFEAGVQVAWTGCRYSGVADVPALEPGIIDGYTDKISYAAGEAMRFFINATQSIKGEIGIYDTAGNKVTSFRTWIGPQSSPSGKAFERGFDYCVSDIYRLPASLPSGVYLLGNKIPFVYKGDVTSVDNDVVVVYPSHTVASSNTAGGGSLESGVPFNPVVSFLRPSVIDRYSRGFLRWLAQEKSLRQGIRFISDTDMEDYSNIASAKIIMVIGHSEVWTRNGRLNLDRFVDQGGNAVILSGNTMVSQVRLTRNRQQLISYKPGVSRGSPDPVTDALLKTYPWYHASLQYPTVGSIGTDFRYAKQGRVASLRYGGFRIVDGRSPLLENTGLRTNDVMPLDAAEFDGTPLSGFDAQGKPQINRAVFNPYRVEILGYENTRSSYVSTTSSLTDPAYQVWSPPGAVATWLVFQKSPQSGYVMNGAATAWTLDDSFEKTSAPLLKKVILNVLNVFRLGKSPFTAGDAIDPDAPLPPLPAGFEAGAVVKYAACRYSKAMDMSSIDSSVVDGYTDKTSYAAGEVMRFFINAPLAVKGEIGVYDTVGKKVATFRTLIGPQNPPPANAFERGFDYCISDTYTLPSTLPSGVYLLANKIPFVYKGDVSQTANDVVVVYPTNTVFAYNNAGGGSLYEGNPFNSTVSYLRPSKIDRYSLGFLKWFAQEKELQSGVRFISDMDMEDYINIASAKVVVLIGHSEYWTRNARKNFDRFVDDGRHAVILSGNTMFWQVRQSGNRQQLICYKTGSPKGTKDPVAVPELETNNWFASSLKYSEVSSIGTEYRYAKLGLAPNVRFGGFKIVDGASPLLKDTGLNTGDILPFNATEFDGTPLKGFDASGKPIFNTAIYNPYKIEVVGYEYTNSSYVREKLPLKNPVYEVWSPAGSVATWIVLQKSPKSGYIMNGAANWWTLEDNFTKPQAPVYKKIIRNALGVLRSGRSPFTGMRP